MPRGAHRRRGLPSGGPTRIARGLAPPLLAVLGVCAVIALLVVAFGHVGAGPGPGTVAAPGTLTTTTPSSSFTTTTPITPAVAPGGASRSPARPSTRPRATSPPRVAVTVLNNSRIHGLAHQVAAQIAAAGWPIATVGNFDGRLPQSTIFYTPGYLPAARALLAAFPRLDRIEPAFPGLTGGPLIAVVTRYYVE